MGPLPSPAAGHGGGRGGGSLGLLGGLSRPFCMPAVACTTAASSASWASVLGLGGIPRVRGNPPQHRVISFPKHPPPSNPASCLRSSPRRRAPSEPGRRLAHHPEHFVAAPPSSPPVGNSPARLFLHFFRRQRPTSSRSAGPRARAGTAAPPEPRSSLGRAVSSGSLPPGAPSLGEVRLWAAAETPTSSS
jgi:hypothetical protein